MSAINKFINSLPGQFLIGGLTIAGINYFSNNIANTAIAGVIAGVPVGLPSTIFVKDAKVSDYSTHLLFMTAILFFVTLLFWVLYHKYKLDKYQGVEIAMGVWALAGVLYVLYQTYA